MISFLSFLWRVSKRSPNVIEEECRRKNEKNITFNLFILLAQGDAAVVGQMVFLPVTRNHI